MGESNELKSDLEKLAQGMSQALDTLSKAAQEGSNFTRGEQLDAAKFLLENGGDIAKRIKAIEEMKRS